MFHDIWQGNRSRRIWTCEIWQNIYFCTWPAFMTCDHLYVIWTCFMTFWFLPGVLTIIPYERFGRTRRHADTHTDHHLILGNIRLDVICDMPAGYMGHVMAYDMGYDMRHMTHSVRRSQGLVGAPFGAPYSPRSRSDGRTCRHDLYGPEYFIWNVLEMR